jgi:hypothetical protein
MPSLSLNIGLNNGRKLPFGGAAPSGIPVASTASVNIAEYPFYSPFTKKLSGYEFGVNGGLYYLVVNSGLIYMNTFENGDFVLIPPNTILSGGLSYTPSTWKITQFSDDDGSPVFFEISTNPSTDTATIPTTGWSPSRTITAA